MRRTSPCKSPRRSGRGGRSSAAGRRNTRSPRTPLPSFVSSERRARCGWRGRAHRSPGGRLDVLFANAGIGFTGDLLATADEDWDRVMAVNSRGVFVCCREAVRQMLAQSPARGSVVINGSISGLVGIPGQAPYAPSKGAVVEMTRQLAVEYARRGARVNCVCPGTVDTPVLRRAVAMSGDPQGFLDMLIAGHPIGRIGRPE